MLDQLHGNDSNINLLSLLNLSWVSTAPPSTIRKYIEKTDEEDDLFPHIDDENLDEHKEDNLSPYKEGGEELRKFSSNEEEIFHLVLRV